MLLLFVEVLDLVEVQQNAARCHERADIGNDVLHVLQGRRRRIQAVERLVRLIGDDIGDCRLSRAGGTVEDHIGARAGIDQAAQKSPFSDQMLLTDHLVQTLRTDLVRKRSLFHFCASLLMGEKYYTTGFSDFLHFSVDF